MKLGAARRKAPAAWRLIERRSRPSTAASFTYRLDRDKLKEVRRREGRYLLRTNLTESDPAKLWQFYLQLVEVEAAFKNAQRRSGDPARSSTRRSGASKRTSSSRSSPTACTSRSASSSKRSPQASPRAACSRSSPPSR